MYRRDRPIYSDGMRESMNELAKKGLALLVLLLAAFVLFKLVVGAVTAIMWTLVMIAAVVAAIWALSRVL
jgi:hypothetical protein